MNLSRIYEDGKTFAKLNKGLHKVGGVNPYHYGSSEYEAWQKGYNDLGFDDRNNPYEKRTDYYKNKRNTIKENNMSIFSKLLKEAVDETEKEQEENLEEVEDTVEEITEPEEDVEEPSEDDPEATESTLVSDTRDLIDSVLDALEEEMVADGEALDGSIDIGLELISKYADKIPTEALQEIYDEISEFYETELVEDGEEGETKTDEFFEPTDETVDPDELAVESIINRKKRV